MKPAVQLPFVEAPAERVELGVFRKQILPLGDVKSDRYGTLSFDRGRLGRLVERFKAGAYDLVPFLLADKDNRHHDDPERVRGAVKDLEITDDGLFANIETSDAGGRLLRENPRLPVSVRLVPDDDGEALGHVLGTLDPVWKGQQPWTLIEASNDRPVIDLSDRRFTLPATVPDNLDLTQEDLDFLRGLRERAAAEEDPVKKREREREAEAKEAEEFLARLLEDAEEVEDADAEPVEEDDKEPVAMSAEDRAALELAKRRGENDRKRIEKLERELAKAQFDNERDELLKGGVPPVLLELSQAVLTAPNVEPIELSNGNKVDPRDTIRKMLQASKGLIDLSERGNADGAFGDEDGERAKAVAAQLKERFGG